MIYENRDYAVTYLNEHYNEIPDLPGIYLYINEDGGIYVGQAKNLRSRYIQHKNANNKNENSFDYQLKRLTNKFSYRVLIYGVDTTILDSLEAMYIHRYNAIEDGYNLQDNHKESIPQNNMELSKLFNSLRKDYINLTNKYQELKEKYNLLKKDNNKLKNKIKHLIS